MDQDDLVSKLICALGKVTYYHAGLDEALAQLISAFGGFEGGRGQRGYRLGRAIAFRRKVELIEGMVHEEAEEGAWLTFPADSFGLVKGTPARYRTDTGAWRTFCATCGTSLTYQGDKRPQEIDVTTGSVDSPEAFPPRERIFEEERVPWDQAIG